MRKPINIPDDLLAQIEKEPERYLADFVRIAIVNELKNRHPKRKLKFQPVTMGRPKKESTTNE